MGTDGIDVLFGEQNIINQPVDSTFDVRISDEWNNGCWSQSQTTATYHTKKQITSFDCSAQFEMIRFDIDIRCHHWPVTASWISNQPIDTCSNSVFTSIHPGGWFDTGSPSDLDRLLMEATGFVTFSSQYDDLNSDCTYTYTNGSDSVSVFWIAIGKPVVFSLKTEETNNYIPQIYPNPTNGILYLSQLSPFDEVMIFSADGKLVKHLVNNKNYVDLSDLAPGNYYLKVISEDEVSNFQVKLE